LLILSSVSWWILQADIGNQLEKALFFFKLACALHKLAAKAADWRIHGFPGVCAGARRSLPRLQK